MRWYVRFLQFGTHIRVGVTKDALIVIPTHCARHISTRLWLILPEQKVAKSAKALVLFRITPHDQC